MERGEAPRVYEDGAQRRDFVHVADISAANVVALTAPEPVVGSFNVASGVPHTVGDMAAALARAMDGPAPVVTGQFRLGDVRHVTASPAAAERALGFRAQVGFEEGMVEFATAPCALAPERSTQARSAMVNVESNRLHHTATCSTETGSMSAGSS